MEAGFTRQIWLKKGILMLTPKSLIICLCLLVPIIGLAQDETTPVQDFDQAPASTVATDSLANTSSTVLLPVLGYTPDTGIMLGGTVLRFFYLEPEFPESRPSVFSPVFIYTLENQTMVFLGLNLNWDENRNTLNLVPRYLKFPDNFYDIGRAAALDDEENYTSERLGLDLDFNRKVLGDWRLGFSYRLLKHRLAETDLQGQLATGSIYGTENSWISALGPALILDTRDNTWSPGKGWWLQINTCFGGSGLGSDYTFREYTMDLRGYWNVGEDLVLAGQSLTTHLEGDAPFFILPRLGGETALRGYRGGLYMDQTRALGRVELRRNHLWKSLGVVVFAGIGDVAPSLEKLTLGGKLWSTGFGLRYLLDPEEKVNLRLDYGFGNGDSGFYLSLGEAF